MFKLHTLFWHIVITFDLKNGLSKQKLYSIVKYDQFHLFLIV